MSSPNDAIPSDYPAFLGQIKERIRSAQYAALKKVNAELIGLYWDIGHIIVARQESQQWGAAVVERLAADVRAAFPSIGGFSARNIWQMRELFTTYRDNAKLQPLVAEIGWTHNLIVMRHCKDDLQREFYLRMTRKYGWTKAVLTHHIENQTYEKTLLGQTNFDKTVPEAIRARAKLAVKDEYTFDFLELGEEYGERELEAGLVANIHRFLGEMGGVFTFAGRQYRLEIGDHEYFIDLLLFHRRLRCLVAVELKVGEFAPEYVGKMQFYLAALDDLARLPDERASIGIILCKSKNKTIVEYALRESNKPIGVAGYTITPALPPALRDEMPTPEQIARLLGGIDE